MYWSLLTKPFGFCFSGKIANWNLQAFVIVQPWTFCYNKCGSEFIVSNVETHIKLQQFLSHSCMCWLKLANFSCFFRGRFPKLCLYVFVMIQSWIFCYCKCVLDLIVSNVEKYAILNSHTILKCWIQLTKLFVLFSGAISKLES